MRKGNRTNLEIPSETITILEIPSETIKITLVYYTKTYSGTFGIITQIFLYSKIQRKINII